MRKVRSFFAQTFLVFVACFQYPGSALGAEANKAIHLKVGYASITGNRIPLWATHDREFFARNGLDTELIFIASSSQGMPALLAGQIPIYSGSLETAAQAAAAGADLVVIASSEPTQYKLIVQPGIKSAADLKGKKVGIDRVGGAELLRHAPDVGKTWTQTGRCRIHARGRRWQPKGRRLPLGNTQCGGFVQSSASSAPASRTTLWRTPPKWASESSAIPISQPAPFAIKTAIRFSALSQRYSMGHQWVKNPKNRTAVLGIVKPAAKDR